ncbi:MAG: nucleotide exchange factor GrpE [Desulfobacterales bacterium]|nr:nucleotide exchange factor GrpE [Desulfobacteraceae bacterium]MBT4365728.1 nucleotide exchange factor GrpE [Desulfobacteraceae bacterium]MBT7085293.1 nucleotide exchange factor GrpE [Desulfobacterales bacterium]MBT7696163.1 nucleotide exchange factor GrpE [Desulfobacterales bacterium]
MKEDVEKKTIDLQDEESEEDGISSDDENAEEPEKDIEDELEAAKNDAKESYDRFIRLSAEFENYKKRLSRERDEFRKFANEALIKEILSVVDNLERAIESAENESENNCVVEGVDMTHKEILKVLEKFNAKPIKAFGETFDPNFHQAVMNEETDEYIENTVIRELQKGYMLHDRLLRPAMVVVSTAKMKNSDDDLKIEEN